MGIRSSVVPSAEVFSRQRKKRLNRNRSTHAEAGQTPDQVDPADTAPPMLEPPVQQVDTTSDLSAPEGQNEAPSTGQDMAAVRSSETVRGDETKASEETSQPAVTSGPQPEPKQKTAPESQRRKSAKSSSEQPNNGERARLHIDLFYPAAGASPTFDDLVKIQSEKVAFRLLLSKALEVYAILVTDGAATDAPISYPESPISVKTTRYFPKAAYDVLAKELNRTGLVSERALGTIIGRRALAAFVARDKGSA